jgi:hypothetical protein
MPTVDVGVNRPPFHHTFCSFRGGTGYHSTLHSCKVCCRSWASAARIALVRTFLSLFSLLNCSLLAVSPGRLSSNRTRCAVQLTPVRAPFILDLPQRFIFAVHPPVMSSPPSPPSPVSRDPDQPVAEPPSPNRRIVDVAETIPSGAPITEHPMASFDAALPRPPFFSMGGNDFRHPSLRGSIVSSLPGTPGPGSNGSLQALHDPHAAAGLDAGPYSLAHDARKAEVEAFASEEHGGLGSTDLSDKHVRGNAGSKKRWIIGAVAALVVVLGISIPLAVVLSGRHSSSAESPSAASAAPDNSPTTASTAAPSTGGAKPQLSVAVTGGDGSTITIDDGTNFTYTNKFGGFWYFDSEDVFKNAAKCNSWTPALNETFQFGSDRIFGVNLGGWLTTEPVRPSIRVLSSV